MNLLSTTEDQRREAIDNWLSTGGIHTHFVYAIASHLTETYVDGNIGRYMWKLAIQGRVYLFQRKIKTPTYSCFEYTAIKADTPPIRSLVAKDFGGNDKEYRKSKKGMPV